MARKHRRREKRARQRTQQQRHRPAQRLQGAVAALRGGDSAGALRLAADALAAANDPATEADARRVVVEALFRLAAATTRAGERLEHLDAALELDPSAFRLRYHRALTLCRLGRVAEAAPEFEVLAAQDANRRDVAALCQLARTAMGQPDAEPRARTSDGPFRDDASALWQTLHDMREQPKAAPVAQLRALADSLEPTGGAGAVTQYYLGVAAMRTGDVETGRAGLAGGGRGRHGDAVGGGKPCTLAPGTGLCAWAGRALANARRSGAIASAVRATGYRDDRAARRGPHPSRICRSPG